MLSLLTGLMLMLLLGACGFFSCWYRVHAVTTRLAVDPEPVPASDCLPVEPLLVDVHEPQDVTPLPAPALELLKPLGCVIHRVRTALCGVLSDLRKRCGCLERSLAMEGETWS